MLSDIKAKAKKHGIKVVMKKAALVYPEGESIGCAGYFDSENKILAVATGCNKTDWLGILAHEASHMDQWIESEYLWKKLMHSYDLFFLWLDYKMIVKAEYLQEAVADIIRLEKDCEIRAIEKIKKYNLPICLETYSRKANAYLFAYLFFLERKKWVPKIYSGEAVWSKAPMRFKDTYDKIPDRLYREFCKQVA